VEDARLDLRDAVDVGQRSATFSASRTSGVSHDGHRVGTTGSVTPASRRSTTKPVIFGMTSPARSTTT